MINIEKSESIGYQSSIEKGFDVLKHGTHDQSSHGRSGGGGGGNKPGSTSHEVLANKLAKTFQLAEKPLYLMGTDGSYLLTLPNKYTKKDVLANELQKQGFKVKPVSQNKKKSQKVMVANHPKESSEISWIDKQNNSGDQHLFIDKPGKGMIAATAGKKDWEKV